MNLTFLRAFLAEIFFSTLKIKKRCNNSGVHLNDKVVVITGANTGIGKTTAKRLAERGANVIIGCRDESKAIKAIDEIKTVCPNASIKQIRLDLSDLSSVRQFAAQVREQHTKIDILINNAGVVMCPKSYTNDGFEMHFGTNHLGHFLLTHLLLDCLNAAPNARIINVSALGYLLGSFDFDDINLDRNYSPSTAYARSKLANVLFTRELSRRLSHTKINSYCIHPGFVRTDAKRHILKHSNFFTDLLETVFLIDADLGAQTTLYCALEESLCNESGYYYENCTKVEYSSESANDVEVAKRLWQMSEDMVKLETHLKIE